MTFIGDLIANGEIKVTVEKIFPMSGVAEALEWSRRPHTRGKTVLTIDHEAGHGDVSSHA